MVMAAMSAKLICFCLTGDAIGEWAQKSDLDMSAGHQPLRFMRLRAHNG